MKNKQIRKKSRSLSLVLIIIFLVSTIRAQEILPDSLVRQRLEVIQKMLDHSRSNDNVWWYSWLIGYGTATLAQGTVCLVSDKLATRQDMALGAISTILGMGSQIISPIKPGHALADLKLLPEETPEENIVKLQEAERLLEECAKREKEGRSWKTHTLDGAINLGFGLVVWLGFQRTCLDGIENFVLNSAICEAQILTQPTQAIKNYNLYCRQYKPDQTLSYSEPQITWSFVMVPGGIGIRLLF